jgi:hypothetical protein
MVELHQTLLTQTGKAIRRTPKGMLALVVGMGFLVAALDTAEVVWPSISKTAVFGGSCAAFLTWVIVEYAITMGMLNRKRSITGAALFFAGSLARYGLILIYFLYLLFFPGGFPQGFTGALLALLALTGVVLVVMLPAWPIEQSQSARFISPLRALEATKGHRIYLFILTGLASSVDRLVPTLTAIHNPSQVVLSLAENTVANAFGNLFAAGVAASAFMFAIKNDPLLAGEELS